jgi:hypothetical protein
MPDLDNCKPCALKYRNESATCKLRGAASETIVHFKQNSGTASRQQSFYDHCRPLVDYFFPLV